MAAPEEREAAAFKARVALRVGRIAGTPNFPSNSLRLLVAWIEDLSWWCIDFRSPCENTRFISFDSLRFAFSVLCGSLMTDYGLIRLVSLPVWCMLCKWTDRDFVSFHCRDSIMHRIGAVFRLIVSIRCEFVDAPIGVSLSLSSVIC